MRAKDEFSGIQLQHDAEGESRPHAEFLHIAFPVLQSLILPDLDADKGSDLLLRQALSDAGLPDDFMFSGDMLAQLSGLPLLQTLI